ncbi:carbohydrate ABC transporter permease [Natrinema salaciae]|uniref:Carbohydrate ABC transporter membrane protein 2, CUT1 family n=1 Tax=Natrinema salaciae TaxID=1186196 RepID=A0A1H9IME3_9EURY|nr:carbohydrate ABC transporter permease [Natrinema salaciae]SEQ75565.1 carbohydrate ABC transporter membrane protein 2, CUT1 family [Natrinema salaciae]
MSNAQSRPAETTESRFERLNYRRVGLYAVLAAIAVLFLVPLISGLMTSIKGGNTFATTLPFVPPSPDAATLEPWSTALSRLGPAMVNSAAVAIPATIISALLGSMTAFGLTKMEWRGQLAVVTLLLAAIFIPYQAVLVPLRQGWSLVGLEHTLVLIPIVGETLADRTGIFELIITHGAYGIPICTILFRSYYQNLNDEILEAARLDGAPERRVYRRIVLPLSIPMFAVTLIYQFTQIWNDFLIALVILNSPENFVVTMELNALAGSMQSMYNVQMAGAFIAALPTLLVYIAFGEQFAKGATV